MQFLSRGFYCSRKGGETRLHWSWVLTSWTENPPSTTLSRLNMAEATELLTATIFVRQSKPDLWPATTKVLKKFSVKCLVSGEL